MMRKKLFLLGSIAFGMLACACISFPARSQSAASVVSKECGVYLSAVTDDSLAAVPRDMLKDWQTAIPCFIQIIASRRPGILKPDDIVSHKEVLKAAKGLRVIFDENGQIAITFFRNSDNLDVISVLTFAARSSDYDFRINTTLVLGNVVDNSTVCVPLDHLLAPDLSTNGRSNLLAVVTGVIGYAISENVENVEKAVAEVKAKLTPDLSDTRRIVQNAEDRLSKRKSASPSDLNPPNKEALLASCRGYDFLFAKNKFRF